MRPAGLCEICRHQQSTLGRDLSPALRCGSQASFPYPLTQVWPVLWASCWGLPCPQGQWLRMLLCSLSWNLRGKKFQFLTVTKSFSDFCSFREQKLADSDHMGSISPGFIHFLRRCGSCNSIEHCGSSPLTEASDTPASSKSWGPDAQWGQSLPPGT